MLGCIAYCRMDSAHGVPLQGNCSAAVCANARSAYDYSPEEKGAQAMQQEAPTAQAATKTPTLPLHVRTTDLLHNLLSRHPLLHRHPATFPSPSTVLRLCWSLLGRGRRCPWLRTRQAMQSRLRHISKEHMSSTFKPVLPGLAPGGPERRGELHHPGLAPHRGPGRGRAAWAREAAGAARMAGPAGRQPPHRQVLRRTPAHPHSLILICFLTARVGTASRRAAATLAGTCVPAGGTVDEGVAVGCTRSCMPFYVKWRDARKEGGMQGCMHARAGAGGGRQRRRTRCRSCGRMGRRPGLRSSCAACPSAAMSTHHGCAAVPPS